MSSTRRKGPKVTEAQGRAYLHDIIYALLLERGDSLRSSDISKALRDTIKVPNRLIKDELSQDPRFVETEHKWDLATRHQLGERPVQGALKEVLAEAGRPLHVPQLVRELALIQGRSVESFEDLVDKLLSGRSFFRFNGDLVGLAEWLLDARDGDRELIRFQNFPDGSEELDRLLPVIEKTKLSGRIAPTLAKEILEAAQSPVSHKVLSFLIWQARPSAFEPVAFFETLLQDEDFALLSGPAWCTAEVAAAMAESAAKIARRAAEEASAGMEEVDVAAILQRRPPKGEKFDVGEAEIEQLAKTLAEAESGATAELDELLGDVFDVYPEDDIFPAAVHAVAEALDAQESLLRVGLARWCAASKVPDEVKTVPETLVPVRLNIQDMSGEDVDPVLSDGGLEQGLAEAVHDPLFEDVGEENEVKVPAKEAKEITECRYILLNHHFHAGTLKVRQLDRGVIPKTPPLMLARLVYPEGDELRIWINNETGLIYGLEPFYSKYCPGSGAVLYLARGDEPDTFVLRYDGESDDETYLDEDRIDELLKLRKQAWQNELSLFDIISRLMESHQQGAKFNTLAAEVNVIRRTARRDIASILSSYHCFYQRKKKPELWHYDNRKVSQGRMKQKKKFVLKRK